MLSVENVTIALKKSFSRKESDQQEAKLYIEQVRALHSIRISKTPFSLRQCCRPPSNTTRAKTRT